MRWFLTKLLILALVIMLLMQNPGNITVSWLGWKLSTTLGVFLSALLLVTFILGLILSGWEGIRNFFKLLISSHSARKRQKGREALNASFTALEVGASADALPLAQKAAEYLPDHGFVGLALLKAGLANTNRAAIRQGTEILQKFPTLAPIPVYHNILDCIHRNQWDKVEEYLLDALRTHPNQVIFLKLTLLKEVHLQQWEEAGDILETLVREKIYTKAYAKQLESHILMHRALKSKPAAAKKLELLKKAYQLNIEPTIALAYAHALADQEEFSQARKVLEASWTEEPSWPVAQLYCELEAKDNPLAQARHAMALGKLTSSTPGKIVPIIYLLRAHLWGEAKERLEKLNHATALKEIFLIALQKQNKADHDRLCAHIKKTLESTAASFTMSKEKYLEQLVLAHAPKEPEPFISPAQVAEMVL